MKKKEVDVSKSHVDLFKAGEGKAWIGEKIAYTKGGWATVTEDGTILEVISAFSGAKLQADFEARDEVPAVKQLDETLLDNPDDIDSDGTNTAPGAGEIIDSVTNPALTATGTLAGANLTGITGSGTNTIAASADVDAAGDDRDAVTLVSLVSAADGYAPYTYAWTANVNGGGAVAITSGVSAGGLTTTLDDIEVEVGASAANGETIVIIGTATDDQASTADVTITLTVVDL